MMISEWLFLGVGMVVGGGIVLIVWMVSELRQRPAVADDEPEYVTFQGLDPWINTNYRDLMERANAAGLKVYNTTTRPQAAEGDGDG